MCSSLREKDAINFCTRGLFAGDQGRVHRTVNCFLSLFLVKVVMLLGAGGRPKAQETIETIFMYSELPFNARPAAVVAFSQ